MLPGISTAREYRRYYPTGEVAGTSSASPMSTMPAKKGSSSRSTTGSRVTTASKRVRQDRFGRVIADVELIRPARPGRISDEHRFARAVPCVPRAQSRGEREPARSGSAVVLDPATGEVLAMVNQPSFNPNDRSQIDVARYRNRAVTDIFEPGSSFKPFVLAAALASGDYTPKTIVDTAPGILRIGNRVVTQDNSNLGRIDLTTVLSKSSNVGMAQVALKMDPDRYLARAVGLRDRAAYGQRLPR